MNERKKSDAAPRSAAQDPPGDLRERNASVWDMVLHLVHPAFLYVLMQLVILSRLWDSPALHHRHPAEPLALGLYAGQFLGAWAVFYTTLLRDMGRRAWEGTLLLVTTFLALVLQFLLFPDVGAAATSGVLAFLWTQAGLAGLLWVSVTLRWVRLKRAWLREQDA